MEESVPILEEPLDFYSLIPFHVVISVVLGSRWMDVRTVVGKLSTKVRKKERVFE